MIRLSDYLIDRFGTKVYRLSLSSGCTCPNRDGKISYGGCTFCSIGGSGEFSSENAPIEKQIETAKERIRKKTDAKRFIAYFQSFTNTYGDVNRLYELYHETIIQEDIVALSLGTRPDCIDDDILAMLKKLREIKPVWIELGLQTIHDSTAVRFNRGYPLSVFEETYKRLKDNGFELIIHVILNLPGETKEDMLDTVRYLSSLKPAPDGIKLQMLQILEGTRMADEYKENPFCLMDLDEYSDLITECVRILPDDMVLHRMTGDGPRKLLIAPLWCLDKKKVLNTLNKKIRPYMNNGKNTMNIRKSTNSDLPRIMEIYSLARKFMADHGNPNQWGPTNWPPESVIKKDIEDGHSYVCTAGERIVGTFYFNQGKDVEPGYLKITEGEWKDDSPYGVVHRIATDGSVKGTGTFCLEWAENQIPHLRIDTHADNIVMQGLVKKMGFVHCGTIYVEEDDNPRMAFEFIKSVTDKC